MTTFNNPYTELNVEEDILFFVGMVTALCSNNHFTLGVSVYSLKNRFGFHDWRARSRLNKAVKLHLLERKHLQGYWHYAPPGFFSASRFQETRRVLS